MSKADAQRTRLVVGRVPMVLVSRRTIGFGIYAAMPYNSGMVFIETSFFTKHVYDYLNEEEYLGLQNFLLSYPDAGPVVPGTGGLRKLRRAVAGRGKRGGVRVIYYWKKHDDEIWMLTMYGKNEASTIPAHILKKIAKEIEDV
jgi:mRNA-degrading endonuclease RelE of RelBE toxin-antitoxin system